MSQKIYRGYKNLKGIIAETGVKKLLLVCGSSFDRLKLKEYVMSLDADIVRFSDFQVNPLYEDVCRGIEVFNKEGCDGIMAVGGGSAIDVAKCVKLYCRKDLSENLLMQEKCDTGVPLIAVPTTAGSGSESTMHAVIYFEGNKQSVSHPSIVPDHALLEPSVLKSLPVYQKKCAMLDALCQGIEAWWSVNSTDESKEYSKAAILRVLENYRSYIETGDAAAAEKIMEAANFSGRAINITATTAAHAMSYKLTSLYKIPHGHAVALSLAEVWEYMQENTVGCIDPRGEEYVKRTFADISEVIDITKFRRMLAELEMEYPMAAQREKELDILSCSVNPVRLKNNPVELDEDTLRGLYERIVK